jgi:hypothetical protein
MTKIMRAVAFIALAAVIIPPGRAQGQPSKHQFLVSAKWGMAIPAGPLREDARIGGTEGVAADYMVTGFLSLGCDLNSTLLGTKSSVPHDEYCLPGMYTIKTYAAEIGISAKLYLARKWLLCPLIEVGAATGWVRFSRERLVPHATYLIENAVHSYHLGGGFDFRISRWIRGAFGVAWHSFPKADGSNSLDFLTASLGVAFLFRPI